MLPKFRTSSSFELAAELSAHGHAAAFTYPGADFSGIDGTTDLFIGSVVHQAFVDVDEHGTEAAAATAVMMAAGAAPPTAKPVEFRCRPPVPLLHPRSPRATSILFAERGCAQHQQHQLEGHATSAPAMTARALSVIAAPDCSLPCTLPTWGNALAVPLL